MQEEDKRKELRRELDKELHLLLECKPVYFVSAERLGMIEQSVARMATTPDKRKRSAEFRAIVKVLKALQVIPPSCDIVGISFGCLDTGDAGMFIICKSPTKVIGQIPEIIK